MARKMEGMFFTALLLASGWLAYIAGGDLWVRQLPAGAPLRLTRGGGCETPRWGASSEWLSFRRGGRTWMVRRDGTDAHPAPATVPLMPDLRKLIRGPLPAQYDVAGVTPDGRHVVFWAAPEISASLRADGLEVEFVCAAGGQRRKTGATTLVHPDFLSFSPDGAALALADGCGREASSYKQIALFEFASGRLRHLTGTGMAALSPAFSPEGKRIAYVAAPDAVVLAGLPRLGPQKYGAPFDKERASVAQRRVWIMQRDGSHQVRLAGRRAELPMWSADGAQILFVQVGDDGTAGLWLMNADGAAAIRVEPLPQPRDRLWDYYGYTDWRKWFDWTR